MQLERLAWTLVPEKDFIGNICLFQNNHENVDILVKMHMALRIFDSDSIE